MTKTIKLVLAVLLLGSSTLPAYAFNHQFKIGATYSLNCDDPNAYAFIYRKSSDLFIKFAFDKGTLAGAGIVSEINFDSNGASFLINSTNPSLYEKFRFSDKSAKLLDLSQGSTKVVENEKILTNSTDSPTYSICAPTSLLYTKTITPNIPKTMPSVDDVNAVKQQLKIDKTAIKYSPELRAELDKTRLEAEKAKKEAAEKEAEEKKKLEQAQALEKQRQAEERAQKEAEAAAAMKAVVSKLKVNGVALGTGNSKLPCKPETSTYTHKITNNITMILYTCDYGVGGDHNEIIFASDKKTVVRVTRKQFLTESDPSTREIVEKAVDYFGKPAKVDADNWLAIYGDAYRVTYNGKRGVIQQNDGGVGLSIKGEFCDEYNICPPKYKYFVKYELIDMAAYNTTVEEGKARAADENKSKLNSIKF